MRGQNAARAHVPSNLQVIIDLAKVVGGFHLFSGNW